MKYLKITNNGELDPMAFLLIGASTKSDDPTKIGEFGSGANYAIAWLLRNKYDFEVFTGEKRVKFDTLKKVFREKEFNVIAVNGKETSFTTSMGKGWLPWFVLREFWANALDEGGAEMTEIITVDEEGNGPGCHGEEGKTTVYIDLRDEMAEAFENWEMYFCSTRSDELAKMDGLTLYPGGEHLVVYRKGIQVYFKKDCPCAFHYDFENMPINEARVLQSEWDLNYRMVEKINRAPREICDLFIRRIKEEHYESGLDFSRHYGANPGEGWKEALKGKSVAGYMEKDDELVRLNSPIMLPQGLAHKLIITERADHVLGEMGKRGIRRAKPNERQQAVIDEAITALIDCGYTIKHQIYFAEFKTRGVMAKCIGTEIFVGALACSSVFVCFTTLIEEVEHIKTQFDDNTRQFQQHFIDLYAQELLTRHGVTVSTNKSDDNE